MESYSAILSESFPAAMRIGLEMGNVELIANARLAFMDGMVGSAMVSASVALITAILVKLYMPRKKDGPSSRI